MLLFSHPAIRADRVSPGRFDVTVDSRVPLGDYDVWVRTPTGLSNCRRLTVDRLVEQIETNANDRPREAQTIALPGAVSGQIEQPADMDFFRFTASDAETVTLQFRSASLDGSVRPAIAIMDSAGRELLHGDGGRGELTLHFLAPSAGDYWIRVHDRAFRRTRPATIGSACAVDRCTFSPGRTSSSAAKRATWPCGATKRPATSNSSWVAIASP